MGQIAPLKRVLLKMAEEHERRARQLDTEEATARQVALAAQERILADTARSLARDL